MADALEILSDCAACLVEGAVVELVDPARARGVAVVARCRLCLREERLGNEVAPARLPRDLEEARAALARWAAEEGEPDLERFCEGGFGGLSVDEVAAKLVAREVVSTNFDVLAWLFGGMSGGGYEPAPAPAPPPAAQPPLLQPSPDAPRFHAGRALASVLLADGGARAAERAFVDRVLAKHGQPPLQPEDNRVWRPMEIGRPDDPKPWIEAMAMLAWADGQRDETEWRVLREFARAWGYPMARLARLDARLAARHAPPLRRAWAALKSLFVVESP